MRIKRKVYALLSLIILAVSIQPCLSQSLLSDSLNRALHVAKHDTTKAILYFKIADEFTAYQPDTAITISKKGIDFVNQKLKTADPALKKKFLYAKGGLYLSLGDAYASMHNYTTSLEYYRLAFQTAEEIKYWRHVSLALSTIGDVYSALGETKLAEEAYLQGLKKAESAGYKAGIALAYSDLGYLYRTQKQHEKALRMYRHSEKIRIEINDKRKLNITLREIARVYAEMGNNVEAMKHYKKAIALLKEINDKEITGNSYISFAGFLLDMGRSEEAIKYYQESFKIQEQQNDIEDMSLILNNLALIYNELGQRPLAIQNYNKAYALAQISKDTAGMSLYLNNAGTLYLEDNNYEEAYKLFMRALALAKQTRHEPSLAQCYENLGDWHDRKQEFSKALKYYNLSLVIRKKEGDDDHLWSVYFLLGQSYVRQKNWDQALTYAQSAFEIASKYAYPKELKETSKVLYKIYKAKGNTAKALEMFTLHIEMRDSLQQSEIQKSLVRNQVKTEYAKKSAADSVAFIKEKQVKDAEIARHQAEISAKKNQQYALYGGLFLVLLFSVFMYNRFKITHRQKELIQAQKHLVEEKNKEITDSINYAKRIQAAILPPGKTINALLEKSFVLFKPKDIVAGDFYWLEQKNGRTLFAVGDCTGHGVPGAMVSVICNNGLNRAVREHNITDPGKILDMAREIMINEFEKSEEDVKDGMDISICAIEKKENITEISWAGANNPFWYIQDGVFKEIKPHKQPVGKVENPSHFPTHHLQLKEGDMFYLFTDGFADQFGGPSGKKFKYKPLQELLFSVSKLPMEEQKNELDKVFEHWRGSLEQIDDVTLVGIRV